LSPADDIGAAGVPPAEVPAARAAGLPAVASGEGSAPAAKRSLGSLALRVGSGILFVPLLILLARAGGWAFLALIALQVTLAQSELYGMMRGKGLTPFRVFGLLASLAVLWWVFRPYQGHADLLASFALILSLAFALRRPEVPKQVESMAVTLFGVLYIGWLSAHLVMLRELPWRAGTPYSEGASFVLLAFFVTWSCDTGAYAVGRWLGRTRPWARISPQKSVEGAAGGFVFAIVAAFVARSWFAAYLSPIDAAALGILVGLFAQVGDLVESLLKRDASHGDSSDLIPGHGGVLDRFDSLYFCAPVVYYYLALVIFRVP